MDQYIERGQHLFNLGRYKEAEKEFQKVLSQEPNNPFGLSMMALCYLRTDRRAEALSLAKQAAGYAPWSAFVYFVLARCYFLNKDPKKALEVIKEGKKINPRDADFFMLESEIELYQENWQNALDAAEAGLEIDPENVYLINLRAQSLIKLNRKEEAFQTSDYALNKAPENSSSHAIKGWAAIERDDYDVAIDHFKESLRLNASSSYAKSGLKEAIKAKNILYRGILKYFLWMSKMQEKSRWAFIIGIYIIYRILIEASESFPFLMPFLMPFIVFYIIFAFSTWIAGPISNLFLRFHPLGKYALEDDEILASNLTGLLALAAISCFIVHSFQDENYFFMVLGVYLGVMLIPVGGMFIVEAGTKARRNLFLYTLTLAIIGALFVILPNQLIFAYLFGSGVFFYGFVANYLIGLAAKEL